MKLRRPDGAGQHSSGWRPTGGAGTMSERARGGRVDLRGAWVICHANEAGRGARLLHCDVAPPAHCRAGARRIVAGSTAGGCPSRVHRLDADASVRRPVMVLWNVCLPQQRKVDERPHCSRAPVRSGVQVLTPISLIVASPASLAVGPAPVACTGVRDCLHQHLTSRTGAPHCLPRHACRGTARVCRARSAPS